MWRPCPTPHAPYPAAGTLTQFISERSAMGSHLAWLSEQVRAAGLRPMSPPPPPAAGTPGCELTALQPVLSPACMGSSTPTCPHHKGLAWVACLPLQHSARVAVSLHPPTHPPSPVAPAASRTPTQPHGSVQNCCTAAWPVAASPRAHDWMHALPAAPTCIRIDACPLRCAQPPPPLWHTPPPNLYSPLPPLPPSPTLPRLDLLAARRLPSRPPWPWPCRRPTWRRRPAP